MGLRPHFLQQSVCGMPDKLPVESEIDTVKLQKNKNG
jgi:hypothetical protein